MPSTTPTAPVSLEEIVDTLREVRDRLEEAVATLKAMRAEHGVKVEDDATKQQGEVFRNRGRAWAFRYYHADSVRRTKGGFATKTEASEARKRKLEELAAPVRRDLSVRELVGSTSTSTSPRRTRSTFSATGSTNMSFRLSATCRWSGCG